MNIRLLLYVLAAAAAFSANASTLSFSPTAYSVNEGAGQVVLNVALDRSADPDPGDQVTVDYKSLSGSATESQDFTHVEGTLTFTAGETNKTISVPILEDSLVENPENFTVILFNPTSGSPKRYGTPTISNATATVTIVDNDIGSTVRFNPTDYTVAEQPGNSTVSVIVTARRVGDPNTPISVNYQTSDGTANAGSDYVSNSGTVTFGPGETQQTIQITVLDDILLESSENFLVTLSNPSGATLDPSGGSVATVNISDDDSGTSTLQFGAATYSASEGAGAVAIKITRSGGIGLVVSVNYATANGSATAGSDYISQAGTVTFASGETQKTISIPINEDSFVENDETFAVMLSSPSAGAALGNPSKTTVTIVDDDATGNKVQFSPVNYTASEQPGNSTVALTVTATRIGDPNTSISVQYATRDGSASAGSFDYAAQSGAVTFGPGQTEQTIFIPVLDDNLIENPENFFVVLTNATNAGIDVNSGGIATVTIADDDSGTSTIQFGAASYAVGESDGAAMINVVRSGGRGFAVSARVDTSNGTAIAGPDYTATSLTVSFAPGEFSKIISIPIIDDAEREPSESFAVTLSTPSGNAVIGSPGTASVTIFDNDEPPAPDNSTKLINVSTRGPVEQGENVMIAGVIVTGSGNKQMLLRGIGPSLTQFGIAAAISDPTLTLYDSNGDQIAFNDDYGTNSQSDLATIAANNLTPSDARESAIVRTLPPSTYTAILRGKTNGVGLVETYDIDRTGATGLANISTRGKVEQNDEGVMIAGFIVSAPPEQPGTPVRVALRAIAPSLTQYGVSGALADPTLDLYRGTEKILSNDNWKSNSAADQQELKNNNLAPASDKESALVTTLDPGSYTVVIRGKNNTSGVALAEVYRLSQ
ncbi:MAG: Calx-beta domain-containing protein [Chthoniobacterales bacterium]